MTGIKEKCLAAHRAGIARILLPKRNEADLDEVPEEVRQDLEICLVSRVDEVLTLVAASALIGAAQAWLAERGMGVMRGPFSLSINEEMGMLVEGFEDLPIDLGENPEIDLSGYNINLGWSF